MLFTIMHIPHISNIWYAWLLYFMLQKSILISITYGNDNNRKLTVTKVCNMWDSFLPLTKKVYLKNLIPYVILSYFIRSSMHSLLLYNDWFDSLNKSYKDKNNVYFKKTL